MSARFPTMPQTVPAGNRHSFKEITLNALSKFLAVVVAFSFTTLAAAADNKKLIVGKWVVEKADEGTLPKGTMAEFTTEGKLTLTMNKGGKDESIDGRYVLDGDAFTVTRQRDGKEQTYKITIKKISDTELDTATPEGKGVFWKKVK